MYVTCLPNWYDISHAFVQVCNRYVTCMLVDGNTCMIYYMPVNRYVTYMSNNYYYMTRYIWYITYISTGMSPVCLTSVSIIEQIFTYYWRKQISATKPLTSSLPDCLLSNYILHAYEQVCQVTGMHVNRYVTWITQTFFLTHIVILFLNFSDLTIYITLLFLW